MFSTRSLRFTFDFIEFRLPLRIACERTNRCSPERQHEKNSIDGIGVCAAADACVFFFPRRSHWLFWCTISPSMNCLKMLLPFAWFAQFPHLSLPRSTCPMISFCAPNCACTTHHIWVPALVTETDIATTVGQHRAFEYWQWSRKIQCMLTRSVPSL